MHAEKQPNSEGSRPPIGSSGHAVALITGGSRGIGRGIAVELASMGWDLLLNYASNESAARESAGLCMEAARSADRTIRVELCQADIGERDDRNRLLDVAKRSFGQLHLLVNNAGIAPAQRADLLETAEDSFDRLMHVNVKGPFFLTQAVARWMIEQGKPEPGTPARKIVTVSSISAYTASVNRGEYCIAKAALSMLTPLFAARLAEHGINTYELRPGVIATDMTAAVSARYDELISQGLTPIRRWGTAEDVAKAVRAIASDLLPFSTGEVINVDGGFHLRRL